MKYDELLEIFRNLGAGASVRPELSELLLPEALKRADELEKVIDSRFRYTGPGPWLDIIKNKN